MKSGKVSERVWKRSILRPITASGGVFADGPQAKGAYPGADCQYLEGRAGMLRCTSVSGTLGGRYDRSMAMFLNAVVNNLAAGRARAEAVVLTLMLPSGMEEKVLQGYASQAGKACADRGLVIAGGHTEITSAVKRPVLSVTGISSTPLVPENLSATGEKGVLFTAKEGKESNRKVLHPGQNLVMAGGIGLAGTVILAKNREQELLERYPVSLIDAAQELEHHLLMADAARIGIAAGISAMHDVSTGGIFGALWEMTEASGVGLEADLKKIPVRQETIEITDHFGINPYQLYGQGALLFGTEQGETLVSALKQRGVPAAVIGRVTEGKDRIIRNGEDCRFLERPQQDALWLLEEKEKQGVQ